MQRLKVWVCSCLGLLFGDNNVLHKLHAICKVEIVEETT